VHVAAGPKPVICSAVSPVVCHAFVYVNVTTQHTHFNCHFSVYLGKKTLDLARTVFLWAVIVLSQTNSVRTSKVDVHNCNCCPVFHIFFLSKADGLAHQIELSA